MYLASTAAANELLERDPLALLIGMLLDQQVPMEKAFTSPEELRNRLGGALDARVIADCDPEQFAAIFAQPPALHRFPVAMAKRVQSLAKVVVEQYEADAGLVWAQSPTGAELVQRLAALPGFGTQKAQIFTALLGKQFDVRPRGWRQAAGPFGEARATRSVADVVDADTLQRVRAYKQQMKAAAKAGG